MKLALAICAVVVLVGCGEDRETKAREEKERLIRERTAERTALIIDNCIDAVRKISDAATVSFGPQWGEAEVTDQGFSFTVYAKDASVTRHVGVRCYTDKSGKVIRVIPPQ